MNSEQFKYVFKDTQLVLGLKQSNNILRQLIFANFSSKSDIKTLLSSGIYAECVKILNVTYAMLSTSSHANYWTPSGKFSEIR